MSSREPARSGRAFLDHIAYALGERACSYAEAPMFEDSRRKHGLPNLPDMFGWGTYYAADGAIAPLAIETAARTLDAAKLRRTDVDAVLYCSVNFHSEGRALYQTLLSRLGLTRAFPIGLTLNDCTMLLSALELARSLVADRYDSVLVISASRVEDERFRLLNYALFSDAAVSCLVQRDTGAGYEILATELMSGVRPSPSGDGLDDEALYRAAHERFARRLGAGVQSIERVFCNNLFAPIVKIKEGRLGILEKQLFLDNIPRISHCFAADPLINLADYSARRALRPGALAMLTSDADGLRAQTGLRFQG
jgi:3-oxoacyl-[acyl-carrier-protein] synthase-3